jgi:hypothetical protein
LALLGGAAASAEVGDLTYVGDVPIQIGRGLRIPGLSLSSKSVAPAPEGSDVGGPGTVVATLTGPSRKVAVAIDFKSARLDFTGEGRFANVPEIPRKGGMMCSFMTQTTYGPTTVTADVDGREIPVTVLVSDCRTFIPRGQQQRSVILEMAVMAVGRCRFGEKVHAVRIIDTNYTLRLGDDTRRAPAAGKRAGAAPSPWAHGDLAQIDTHNEAFRQADIQTICGQGVLVDGAWYRITIDAGKAKVSAEPVRIEAGKVLIPKPRWSVLLVGEKNHLMLSGGKAPVAVPAGTYTVYDYRESLPADGKATHTLSVSRAGAELAVKPGQTAKLEIGSPLVGKVTVSQAKGTVALNMDLKGAAANAVRLSGPKGWPPRPTVAILDERGKEAHTATLKYG